MLFISCEISSPKSVAIIILADRTDPIIPKPKLEDIRALLDLKTNPNNGVEITLKNIGNVDFSPLYQVRLKSASLLDNTLKRNADIKLFFVDLDTLITRENTKVYDYQNSSIIVPLVAQLEVVSNSKTKGKSIVLYSDLAEFSDLFNVYDYASGNKLQKQPLEVAELFKSKLNIPKLNEVNLYIIYYPKTITENRMFQNMIHVYREVFKDSGLQIHIGLQQF